MQRILGNVDRMDDRTSVVAHSAQRSTDAQSALLHFLLARKLHRTFLASFRWSGRWCKKHADALAHQAEKAYGERKVVFGAPGVSRMDRNAFSPTTPRDRGRFRQKFIEFVVEPAKAMWEAAPKILDVMTEKAGA